MVTRNRIKLGLEIECCYNMDLLDFNIGGYHSDRIEKIGKNWKICSDSSLCRSRKFDTENTAEFISGILGSKKTLINALEEFRSFFKGYPLNEVLDFNNSCGNHIHIGLNGDKKYHDKMTFEDFKNLRELFFKQIKDSNNISEETKTKILNQYYRHYSEQIKKENWKNKSSNRYMEFNKQSENSGLGIEWRSINLCGVKNWKEFNSVFEIVYNCCEWLFKKRTTNHKEKFNIIRLNRTELRQLIKNNTENLTINIQDKNTSKISLRIKSSSEVLQCVI
jgi:hypothetical protein